MTDIPDQTLAPPDPDNTNNWYIGGGTGTHDTFVGAGRAADATGNTQQVHHHPYATSCVERHHTFVEPDERRSAAIRGRQ